jgi:tetratricopeptide (TPR) repeat protein
MNQVGSETEKYKNALQESYSYMGWYYTLKKDYTSAKLWYEKLFILDPKNKDWQIKALSALGGIGLREKNYEVSRDAYQKILNLEPGNAEVQQTIKDLTKVINAAQK